MTRALVGLPLQRWMDWILVGGALLLVLAPAVHCLRVRQCTLLTADQKGHRLFTHESYEQAAERFTDPMWKGAALYEQGAFKEASAVFAGYDTAEAAFNHGNALAMQGKYEEAAERYVRALELKPGWDAATINRDIVLARAEVLQTEGAEMTDGQLAADEIVFSPGKSPPSAGEEQVAGEQNMSDAELRAVWLRQVQTKPVTFLRAKFAYQHAKVKDAQ